jgi:MFS family permease
MQVTLVIDNSVVNVALPVIRDELGFSAAGLSWVVTSYALAFGGLVLLSGRVGSIIGPRRALLIGISVFVAASAFGGLAVTPEMLIVAARVLQGLGAALAAPRTLVLLMAGTEPGVQQARAMSLFVLSIGLGAGLGLSLGGALTSGLGWHWVMFVNAYRSAPRCSSASKRWSPRPTAARGVSTSAGRCSPRSGCWCWSTD